MKKYFGIVLMIALMISSVTMVNAKKNADAAKASFSEEVYDFGTIPEDGGKVSHDFEFVNTGSKNLVVLAAKAECGCTTPEYPKQPIAPGKTGVIKVTYNPKGRPGSFTKVVTLTTNGDPAKVRIKIKGKVK